MPEPAVICTVDVVLLTLSEGELAVALFQREKAPFEGVYALPGGYIHADEDKTSVDAALRVLEAKTGVKPPYLEQLCTFAGADRDPRGWSMSLVYFALVPLDVLDASTRSDMLLCPVDRLPDALAFDHREIIDTARERLRSKSVYSSLPVMLMGNRFTIPKLKGLYEAILGEPLDKVTFRKKILDLGILEPIEGAKEHADNRPAQLYRVKRKFRTTLATMSRAFNSAG